MSKSLRRAVSVAALIASSMAWSAATIAAAEAQTFSITIKAVGNDETLKLSDGSMTKAPIAPGVYAVINGGALFTPRQPAGPTGLEALAEDGNPEPLLGSLKNKEEVRTMNLCPWTALQRERETRRSVVFCIHVRSVERQILCARC